MKWVLAAAVVLVACKKDTPAPPPAKASVPAPAPGSAASEQVHEAQTAVVPQPCPAGPALKDAVAKALGAKADEITEVVCNAMSTPRKLWAVDAILMTDIYRGTLALLDARDGKLVSKEMTGESDGGLAMPTDTVADLDGDGADELLRSATVGGGGFASEAVHVYAVRGDKLVEVGKLPVRSENTGAVAIGEAKQKDHYECQSTTKVIAGATGKKLIEIVGAKRKGKPPGEDCPPVGRRVYAFDGKTISEAKG
jgi:hypothetical protein